MKAYFYSATGNLLWLIEHSDLTAANVMRYAQIAKDLCEHHHADGLMLMNAVSLELWIINADGSNGGFCGNGICAAAYHLQASRHLKQGRLKMAGRDVEAQMHDSAVTIALAASDNQVQMQLVEDHLTAYALKVPNPHLVIIDPPQTWTLQAQGAKLCAQYDSNIEFVYPTDSSIRVAVYERGAGITAACGSGAIAVFRVLQHLGRVKTEAEIQMPGGNLTIRSTPARIYLSGQVRFLTSEELPCI